MVMASLRHDYAGDVTKKSTAFILQYAKEMAYNSLLNDNATISIIVGYDTTFSFQGVWEPCLDNYIFPPLLQFPSMMKWHLIA
jgi:hypothetical protein